MPLNLDELLERGLKPLGVILGFVIAVAVLAGVLGLYTNSVNDIVTGVQGLFLGSVWGLLISIVAAIAVVGIIFSALRQ